MNTFLRALVALAVGATALVAASATAGADPKNPPVHLECDGTHYEVATAGNGHFTPAHDDLVTNEVVFEETDPSVDVKGSAQPRGRTLMECTYSFTEVFTASADDPDLIPGRLYRFSGEGAVTGFASGSR